MKCTSGIAGMDEAGRGAIAGPVVAAACVVTQPLFRRRSSLVCWGIERKCRDSNVLIADSKALSAQQREEAFGWIAAHCAYGIGIVHADVIDRIGIKYANYSAMQAALIELRASMDISELHVDGNDGYTFDVPSIDIIGGDRIDPCIAAASIVAKVSRDRLMVASEQAYPGYDFALHKGYGTAHHICKLRELGPTGIHRRTFIRGILETQALPLEFA
jgi:ribonuclease HII